MRCTISTRVSVTTMKASGSIPLMSRLSGASLRYAMGWDQIFTGCCPNRNPFERALKRLSPTNLGEVGDKRCQLFEPQERVLTSPGASPRFNKKGLRPSEKGFGQQPVKTRALCFYLSPWPNNFIVLQILQAMILFIRKARCT
jgi:hypothetical protein